MANAALSIRPSIHPNVVLARQVQRAFPSVKQPLFKSKRWPGGCRQCLWRRKARQFLSRLICTSR